MASVIASMQAAPVDKLMFYDAQMLIEYTWNNLFTGKRMRTHAAQRGVDTLKGYWSLYGWNELYKAGRAIACDGSEDIYCAAAKDPKGGILVYIAYFNDDACLNACPPPDAEIRLEIGGKPVSGMTVRRVDDEHDFGEETVSGPSFAMKGNSFALVLVK